MTTVSRRAYATRRGCSEAAVRKALSRGRITLAPDGRIDPVKADREWRAHTDPARSHRAQAAAKRVKVVSDYGENLLIEIESSDSDRWEFGPESATHTVQQIADCHRVTPAVGAGRVADIDIGQRQAVRVSAH